MTQIIHLRRTARGFAPRTRSSLPAWLPLVLMVAAGAWAPVAAGSGLSVSQWVRGGDSTRLAALESDFETASGPPEGGLRECTGPAQRTCVVDGHTIRYEGKMIRLQDIDAPEIDGARCTAEHRLGQRAKRRMVELLSDGGFVVIDTGGRDADSFGRKLRIVARNGRSVGAALIGEGLARRWTGSRWNWC